MEVFNTINLEAKGQSKGIVLVSGRQKLRLMGMKRETSLYESLDILIVSIKLHMIINIHLHIQWSVIERQNPITLDSQKM